MQPIDTSLSFMSIRREELGRSRAKSLASPDSNSDDAAELFHLLIARATNPCGLMDMTRAIHNSKSPKKSSNTSLADVTEK